jgi:hypothetical protein
MHLLHIEESFPFHIEEVWYVDHTTHGDSALLNRKTLSGLRESFVFRRVHSFTRSQFFISS